MRGESYCRKKGLRSAAAVLFTAALFLSACGGTAQKEDSLPQSGGQETKITDFLVDHRKDPICVTPEHLTFAWKMAGDGYGLSQSAYRIVVSDEADGQLIWDSGKVSSDSSLEIPYEGEALKARNRYRADLSVWDQDGTELPHAEASFEMAGEKDLFQEASWIAVPESRSKYLYPEIGADSTFVLEADVRMPQDRAGLVWGYAQEDQKLYREQICLNREDDTAS
ncbi:MAG: hypothetical protein K6B72_02220, partial [Lachnospiraceae bacterium]|nr:hypothetical protein [Lachnospiraceae bacterium]